MSARRGFTLIELLVVIAIIAILAAILFRSSRGRARRRRQQRQSNLKQLGIGVADAVRTMTRPVRRSTGLHLCSFRIVYTVLQPYIKTARCFSVLLRICRSATATTAAALGCAMP